MKKKTGLDEEPYDTSIAEAARIFGVSEPAMRGILKAEGVEGLHIGSRRVRFRKGDILRLIQERTKPLD